MLGHVVAVFKEISHECEGPGQQIPFGNDSKKSNGESKGGFVLCTNMAHISKSRCGAPSDHSLRKRMIARKSELT
jgi:hypothetical protein